MVTLFPWIEQRLVSSNRPTRYSSFLQSGNSNALEPELCLEISLSATIPDLKRWGFFTPPVVGVDFLAAFVTSCLPGAFPPFNLLAVCVMRAI
ncbi:hypothetical protein MRB53_024585 [Persea americana]|uniref:Uncharacterized protein n=1 Tax=Persea americana TaxID=3435 RepID=A0ACC2LDS8_PERAE|nr:hypothetical protein MRB53_024585 [Persea americana]